MSDQQFYSLLAGLCETFLTNYEHASRKGRTEEIIRKMKAQIDVYLEPPALGVHVSDTIEFQDRTG